MMITKRRTNEIPVWVAGIPVLAVAHLRIQFRVSIRANIRGRGDGDNSSHMGRLYSKRGREPSFRHTEEHFVHSNWTGPLELPWKPLALWLVGRRQCSWKGGKIASAWILAQHQID